MPQVGTISPRSMEDANEEINQILKSEFQRAKGSLLMEKVNLEKVVKELLDEKTMTQERLIGILGGH